MVKDTKPTGIKYGKSVTATFVAAVITVATGAVALAHPQGGHAQPQQQAPQPTAEQQQQIAALQQQFAQISERLQAIQSKALETEEVQEKRGEFDQALNTAIIAVNPSAEPLVEQRTEVLAALLDHEDIRKPAEQRSPEFNQQVEVFRQLDQQLQPMQQQAASQPEVVEAQQEYETVLIEKMEEIDSDTPNLLASHNQIMQQFQQIMGGAN